MSPPIIEVEGLGKRYTLGRTRRHDTLRDQLTQGARGLVRAIVRRNEQPSREDFWALRDVSFEMQPGDVLGIIGRNGAGKSTLLKVLSRITEPTAGRVTLRGRVASLLEVGTGFHPELSGRENIILNGAILGMTRREVRRKFDAIVEFAEVERFLDTAVKHYSSGMYVRLAFAVAAHLEPEILIVDEVLAVGDAAFQKKCLGKMQAVAEGEGRTVLFVSHNVPAIQSLCKTAIWLSQGQLVQAGAVGRVVNSYLDSTVDNVAERVWRDPRETPGDDRVRLLATRIVQNGRLAPILDINQSAQVEFEFEVLRTCKNLISGVNFQDATGTCLFVHCDWRPNEMRPGLYRKHVTLPPQIFAEGSVQVLVELVFHDPRVQSVFIPEAIGFEAVDSDVPNAVRGLYHGPWPGVMRLGLEWSDPELL